MKFLGIDYGAKWVGIATSNDGQFAFPKMTVPNDGNLETLIEKLIRDEHIEQVVIGDARTFGGGANTVTSAVEDFIARMKSHSVVPIETVFEAWSSQEAARYAPNGRKHDDASAAAIILQRFLDFHRTQ